MTEILVKARAVVRSVSPGGEADVVDRGAILVRDKVIVAVDAFDALRLQYPAARIVGSDTDVATPGFVNAHHHVGLTPFQLGAPDLPLELWLAAKIGLRRVDPYLDTLHSAFELIASGVTTVQHLDVSRSPPDQVPGRAEAILRAYADVGLRASYSFAYRDQNLLVYGADEDFLESLPATLAQDLRPWFAAQRMSIDESLDLFVQFRHLCDRLGDGRLAAQLAPASLHWCSDEALSMIAAASRRYAAPVHIHVLETSAQRAYVAQRDPRGAMALLDDLGLLGPQTTLGHMVWATDDDLDLVAERGACVCHNPSSNLRLGSGVAPCRHFVARGICTAIGIDEAGINDDRDMLQEMRLAVALQRGTSTATDAAPQLAEAFRMATEGGALTTPFAGRVGRLDPGTAADIVLFDWARICGPYLDAQTPIVDTLVQRAKTDAVRAVMVDGRMIYENGQFAFVDREVVRNELSMSLSRPPDAEERRRRGLAASIRPFVQAYYSGRTLAASIDGVRPATLASERIGG